MPNTSLMLISKPLNARAPDKIVWSERYLEWCKILSLCMYSYDTTSYWYTVASPVKICTSRLIGFSFELQFSEYLYPHDNCAGDPSTHICAHINIIDIVDVDPLDPSGRPRYLQSPLLQLWYVI